MIHMLHLTPILPYLPDKEKVNIEHLSAIMYTNKRTVKEMEL